MEFNKNKMNNKIEFKKVNRVKIKGRRIKKYQWKDINRVKIKGI